MARVVINEIAWAGTEANAADEWVELFNAGTAVADVEGWALFEGETKIITLTKSIAPGAYYLIERTDDMSVSDITADAYAPFGGSGLKNLPGGEDLTLRDASGTVIDSVPCSGGWYAGTNSPKTTMERINPDENGSLSTNWTSNTSGIRNGLDANGGAIAGTPRARNSAAK